MALSQKLRLFLLLLIVAIVAVQGVLLAVSDSRLAESSAEKVVSRELIAAARTGAAFLDGDLHERLSLSFDATSPEWKTLRAGLAKIAERNGLTADHCYTFARPSSSLRSLRFAVMLQEKTFAGEIYSVPAANEEILKTLVDTKKPVATGVYKDEHGEWLSAMAPILTSRGDLAGILQMDFTAGDVLKESAMQIRERRRAVLTFTALAGLLSLLLGQVLISRWVSAPLSQIVTFSKLVAEGKSTEALTVRSEGELGILAESLNKLGRRLNEMVAAASTTSRTVADLTAKLAESAQRLSQDSATGARAAERTSSHVSKLDRSALGVAQSSTYVTGLVVDTTASIEEMMAQVREIDRSAASLMTSTNVTASAIQEMGSNIAEVAQNADFLSVQVSDAAVSMEQVGRSIRNVDKSGQDLLGAAEATGNAITSAMDSIRLVEQSAQDSERLAQIVVADAENGRARVRSTREGMEGIKAAMGEVVTAITHLGDSSVRIGEILDLIEKVAGQTNVLALNAALIAAHAGGQGKAFGVVATKIRELSSGTSERTKDIARLIGSVRGDVTQAMAGVQRAQRAVERGGSFASEAEVALDKILGSAREASRLAQGIARATVEQLVLGQQIAKAMDKVKLLTGDISRATEEQSRAGDGLVNTMESLRERATLFKRATVELRTGSVQIVSAIDNVAEHVREISRATAEQAKGGKAISGAVAEIELAARTLGGSAADQSQDSKQAVSAMAEINDIVKRNASRVQEIDRAVSVLLEESGRLVRDVSALRL